MAKYRISIWGDSFTRGFLDPEMGGWVSRLKKYFDNQEKWDVDVYNVGVSGATTQNLLERFTVEAEARKSRTRTNIFVFQIGINDAQYLVDQQTQRVLLSQFQNNLQLLYLSAKKFTDAIIFLGLTNVDENKTVPTSWNANHAFYSKDVVTYNEALQHFCLENTIPLIPLSDIVLTDDLEDGCHPNVQGHEKIYTVVRDFLLDKQLI